MSYSTLTALFVGRENYDPFMGWDENNEDALIQAVEAIDPDFAEVFQEMRRHGSTVLKDVLGWVTPIFVQLSEKLPQHTFTLVGIGEDSDDVWARKFERGQVFLRELAKEWKPDTPDTPEESRERATNGE